MTNPKIVLAGCISFGIVAGLILFNILAVRVFHGNLQHVLLSIGGLVGGGAGFFVGNAFNDVFEEADFS